MKRYYVASFAIAAFLLFARVIAWAGPGGGFTSRPPTLW